MDLGDIKLKEDVNLALKSCGILPINNENYPEVTLEKIHF